MNLRKIQNIDLTDKRVLVRVDFNMPINEDGSAGDIYKIKVAKETIDYIMTFKGVKLALISHLGRPGGEVVKSLSLTQISGAVSQVISRPVRMACDCIGVCVTGGLDELTEGEVLLLENVRFHKKEKENDEIFSQQLAAPFDIYINEAFAVSHRAQASLHGITQHIPSYAGIWLQREVEMLSRLKENISTPAVALIGGAKIETKIPLITAFDKLYDSILVGGRTSVEALDAGMDFSDHVILPSDFAAQKFDIGPKTIEVFESFIADAKTIVWNGPMGKFEESPYDAGTIAIANAIAKNNDAFSVVGGGESVQALRDTGHFDDVSFVSTGGGAMLAFISDQPMPALEMLAA